MLNFCFKIINTLVLFNYITILFANIPRNYSFPVYNYNKIKNVGNDMFGQRALNGNFGSDLANTKLV